MDLMNENSILATTNPMFLLGGGIAICILAFICVRKYRNTNDFAKSARLYFPLMAVLDIIFIFLMGLDLILVAGLDICGFIALALISNYYFYH